MGGTGWEDVVVVMVVIFFLLLLLAIAVNEAVLPFWRTFSFRFNWASTSWASFTSYILFKLNKAF